MKLLVEKENGGIQNPPVGVIPDMCGKVNWPKTYTKLMPDIQ